MNDVDRLYERVLVLRCQTGDIEAFELLIERYNRRLLYYIRRMLPQQDAANDVLQDVWLAAFRSIKRLTDAGAFQSWVYQIAHARCCGWWRSRRPAEQIDDIPEPQDETGHEFSGEDAELVHAALGELDAEHREMLVLRFLEDMSYEEIAKVTGCQIGTVRSRLHYGKAALRRILELRGKHA